MNRCSLKERKAHIISNQKSCYAIKELDAHEKTMKIKSLISQKSFRQGNTNSAEVMKIQARERQEEKDFRSIILKNHLILQQLKSKLTGNPSRSAEIMFKVP